MVPDNNDQVTFMTAVQPLPIEQLSTRSDASLLDFDSTAELTESTEVVGQQRAVEAIELAIDLRQPGYNLFVLGESGSGRHSVVRHLLEKKARTQPAPDDWCYVNNFAEPDKPRLLRVPAGRGAELARDMEQFVNELTRSVAAAFESEQHQARVEAINNAYKAREESALQELGQAAIRDGIGLLRTPRGFVFTPMKGDEAMSPDEFEKLPAAEQQRLGRLMESHGEKLTQLMQQMPRWRREVQAQIKDASRDTLQLAAGHLIDELRERYRALDDVVAFLDEVMKDVVEAGEPLREQPARGDGLAALVMSGTVPHARYRVNALVSSPGAAAAPVIYEDNPIHPNLVGRIDQVAQFGTLVTSFMLIKPGALHKANGGYLVLDAVRVLTQPHAWESLKRALSSGQVRIESVGQAYGLVGTAALEPQPVPLSLKVVMIGERRVYYLLKAMDPDFAELFKIAADFEDDVIRDAASVRQYARFIATLARGAGLRPLDRGAVGRLIDHSARLCGDGQRLSANRRQIADLLREADHVAAAAGRSIVSSDDIETALQAQIRRVDRLRGRIHDEILRGNLLISVEGARVGQVNGLSVVMLDDFMFAHPTRITATVRVGEAGVIDIEREVELGGAIHSKGVMILAAFLGARYSRSIPLSLSASLVFEQSYGGVEGDSASLAELCALLSDLATAPVRQGLAVTGSVNQFGDVQAIGAVNEKIEGFFDICKARGLSGEQGVLIPADNVKHLMLRQEVVTACAEGRFRVYAVRNVDEAIELLTGIPAGEADEESTVPAGSINYLVAEQLAELSAIRQAYAAPRRRRSGTRSSVPPTTGPEG